MPVPPSLDSWLAGGYPCEPLQRSRTVINLVHDEACPGGGVSLLMHGGSEVSDQMNAACGNCPAELGS